jgi:hypothetical protein
MPPFPDANLRHTRPGVARDQGGAPASCPTGFQLLSSELLSKIMFWQTMTETPRSQERPNHHREKGGIQPTKARTS